ncbi:nose resistant to fluoxetine protein 6-like isoform X1 [Amblyomma americanum]
MRSLLASRRCCLSFHSKTEFVIVAVHLMFLVIFGQQCTAENVTTTGFENEGSSELARAVRAAASAEEWDSAGYAQALREVAACGMASIPKSIRKKLLGAEIRLECSVALLQTMRALQNFELWPLRLLDATGKYPTGLLQGSRSDPGAFDECIETVVRDSYGNDMSRGQYCNMVIYIKNATAIEGIMESALDIMHPTMRYFKKHFTYMEIPILRLGICFLDDCSQQDLQNMVDSVTPSIIDVQVSDCVTAEPVPWTTTQKGIVIFLGILAVAIAAATGIDLFMPVQPKGRPERSTLVQFVKGFSVASNTHHLLRVASRADADRYALQFVHGLRIFSLGHVVLGHCFMTVSESVSRLLNFLIDSTHWSSLVITAAFNSVDTFFFISGFLLCFILMKQSKNSPILFVIGVVRRLIRTCVPLFFIIMCFYIVPLFINGPETKTFFLRFHEEVAYHWWHFLLHIQNYYEKGPRVLLGHIWFLSADFQLFVVALPTLLLLKSRRTLALGACVLLALLSYAVAAWTLASRPEIQPFVIIPGATPQGTLNTINKYYQWPFCHGMCYFSGCITCLIMENFRERKLTKVVQIVGWSVTAGGMLCCVFMKLAWYTSSQPTTVVGSLLAAFCSQFLWSISLVWITLTCSTGRGGFVARFLSCDVFVPLSKLSFGIYIIHLPFIELMLFASRERVFWSHFNQVSLFFSVFIWSVVLSYFSYVACEAPTSALDRLAFSRLRGSGREPKDQHTLQNGVDVESYKRKEDITFSRC